MDTTTSGCLRGIKSNIVKMRTIEAIEGIDSLITQVRPLDRLLAEKLLHLKNVVIANDLHHAIDLIYDLMGFEA